MGDYAPSDTLGAYSKDREHTEQQELLTVSARELVARPVRRSRVCLPTIESLPDARMTPGLPSSFGRATLCREVIGYVERFGSVGSLRKSNQRRSKHSAR